MPRLTAAEAATRAVDAVVLHELDLTIALLESRPAREKEAFLGPLELVVAERLRVFIRAAVQRFANSLWSLSEATPTAKELDAQWQQMMAELEDVLLTDLSPPFTTSAAEGATQVLGELNWALSFALANANAEAYMAAHGAALVSQISTSLRDDVRQVLSDGIKAGKSSEEIAKDIRLLGVRFTTPKPQQHIRDRAHLIAVTELAKAYEGGSWHTANRLTAAGIGLEKRWLALNDGRVDNLCIAAKVAGWVPKDHVYAREVLVPPMHPACRCTSIWRWEDSAHRLELLRAMKM